MSETLKERTSDFFSSLQIKICGALEEVDGEGKFTTDTWDRPGGGGGVTRILEEGKIFEKGGVNFSAVFGTLPEPLARKMNVMPIGFFATGVSVVIHPQSPMIPTVHANLRYFEMEDGKSWFGGGTDITPYYLFPEDAVHFHSTLKSACDSCSPDYYPEFKKQCDEYFFIKHRFEARGIGGVFFDYLSGDPVKHLCLVRSIGDSILGSYLPIVRKRMKEPWGERERHWQLIRRGRYVEFNLVYDRGTMFGLETDGRVESILMSLPPLVRWNYDFTPEEGSRESELLKILRSPKDWVTPS